MFKQLVLHIRETSCYYGHRMFLTTFTKVLLETVLNHDAVKSRIISW